MVQTPSARRLRLSLSKSFSRRTTSGAQTSGYHDGSGSWGGPGVWGGVGAELDSPEWISTRVENIEEKVRLELIVNWVNTDPNVKKNIF